MSHSNRKSWGVGMFNSSTTPSFGLKGPVGDNWLKGGDDKNDPIMSVAMKMEKREFIELVESQIYPGGKRNIVFISFVQKEKEQKGIFGRSEKLKWQLICITNFDEGYTSTVANLDIAKINVEKKDDDLKFALSKEWPFERVSGVIGNPIDNRDITIDFGGETASWKAINEIETMRIEFVIIHLCQKFLLYTPRIDGINSSTLEKVGLREMFEDSCILLKETVVDKNTNKGNEKVKVEDPKQNAAFLMTPTEQDAIDYLLLKDVNWSAFRCDSLDKEVNKKIKALEGRMINTLLAWQEERDGPLLTLVRELDMVDEELGKMETLLEDQNESLISVQNGLFDIQIHNERLDLIVANQVRVKETLSDLLGRFNVKKADLTVMRELPSIFKDIPDELNGMANKVLKLGYDKAIKLMEGKSDDDATTGIFAVIRVGRWLKNALLFGENTSESSKALQGLKAVSDRTADLEKLKINFATKSEDFLKDLFRNSLSQPPNPDYAYYPFVPAKKAHHSSSILVAPLMHLVIELDPPSFNRIVSAYVEAATNSYRPEYKEQLKSVIKIIKISKEHKGKLSDVHDSVLGREISEISSAAEYINSETSVGIIFLKAVANLREMVESEYSFCSSIFSEKHTSAAVQTVAHLFEQVTHDLEKRLILFENRSDFHLLTMSAVIENAFASSNRVLHSILSPLKAIISEQYDTFLQAQVTYVINQKPDGRYLGIFQPISKLPVWIDYMMQAMDCGRVNGKISETVNKSAQHGFDVIIKNIFTQLRLVAEKRDKYTDIILMENNYFFYRSFSSRMYEEFLKVSLEKSLNDYKKHQENYISWVIHEQFEKVNDFFVELQGIVEKDGVEVKLTPGLMEEIKSLQGKFSKISKLEAKNIDKSVKLMWQRVDKHICIESRLFEIVWKALEANLFKKWCKWEAYALKFFSEPLLPSSTTIATATKLYTEKPSATKKMK